MYILDINKLEAGDIFLTTKNQKISKAIRVATSSDYSHAILYVGDGSYRLGDAHEFISSQGTSNRRMACGTFLDILTCRIVKKMVASLRQRMAMIGQRTIFSVVRIKFCHFNGEENEN